MPLYARHPHTLRAGRHPHTLEVVEFLSCFLNKSSENNRKGSCLRRLGRIICVTAPSRIRIRIPTSTLAPDSTGLRNGGLLGSKRFQLVTWPESGAGMIRFRTEPTLFGTTWTRRFGTASKHVSVSLLTVPEVRYDRMSRGRPEAQMRVERTSVD